MFSSHIIWDCEKKDIKEIYNFKHVYVPKNYSFIHFKKRNQLMLIGRQYDFGYCELDDINICDLNTLKWSQLDLKFNTHVAGLEWIVTNDEKYLIIMGRDIYVLNLDSMKWPAGDSVL